MPLRTALRAIAHQTPGLRGLLATRDRLLAERSQLVAARAEELAERDRLRVEIERRIAEEERFVPPGHFYSPIPAQADIVREAARLFPDPPPRTLPAIDLREAAQMALLEQLIPFYREIPFGPEAQPGLRYRYENGAFSYADAIFLYLMLRHARPKRVIEVGSGHSSCVTLDTRDRFLATTTQTIFIEPYPELLHSLLQPGDRERLTIMPARLQDVPLDTFAQLEADDILFIDSTHVAKIGSDVAFIFNDILPALRPGVYVHFHDIFYPFEYPRYWIEQGRAWNEAYMLRSFLQYNTTFRIELWNHFLLSVDRSFFEMNMPLCLKNPGASLWLKRV